MRHPIEKYNQQQATMLAELPESQRESMARMFRIGNASYRYYQRAKELTVLAEAIDPAQDSPVDSVDELVAWLQRQLDLVKESRSAPELLTIYFEEFLAGLPHEGLRRTMQQEGIGKAKRSLPFLRYLLERHDIGMDEFLQQNLSADDYAFYVDCGRAS